MSTMLPATVLLSALLAAPGRPTRPGWTTEQTAAQVVLKLRSSSPVVYGYVDPVRPELVLSCDRASKAVEAYVDVGVKPNSWDFAVRLDADPAIDFASRMRAGSGAEVLHQLAVPAGQARAFAAALAAHRTMVLRFTRDRLRETTYDLAGLDTVIGPFAAACGLEADVAAARTEAPGSAPAAAPRSAPAEAVVGSWKVLQKSSALDDKPVVVLVTEARGDWSRLVLRCQEGTVDAYVVSGSVIDTGNKPTVALPVAVDGEPLREVTASPSADLGALFLPDAARFVRSLRGHSTLKVQFQRYRAKGPVTPVFALEGLDRALARFTAACPLD
jgi:hypothetical protein